MRDRARHVEGEARRPAEPPAPADNAALLALQLQRTAGNQATARLLQRGGVMDVFAPGLEKGFEWFVWNRFVRSNRESATYHTIDSGWRQLALRFSREHPT